MESEKREQPEWIQKIIFELNKKESEDSMDNTDAEDNTNT